MGTTGLVIGAVCSSSFVGSVVFFLWVAQRDSRARRERRAAEDLARAEADRAREEEVKTALAAFREDPIQVLEELRRVAVETLDVDRHLRAKKGEVIAFAVPAVIVEVGARKHRTDSGLLIVTSSRLMFDATDGKNWSKTWAGIASWSADGAHLVVEPPSGNPVRFMLFGDSGFLSAPFVCAALDYIAGGNPIPEQ